MGSRGTHREVKATRTDTIIKSPPPKKRNILIDEAIPEGMIVTQKEAENKLNTRVYIYRYTNAENEMYEYNLNT